MACNLLGEKTMSEPDDRNTLHDATIKALKEDKRTLRMIAQATGVPFFWLKKLSADEIKAPNVNRIQYVFEFLTKKRLLA